MKFLDLRELVFGPLSILIIIIIGAIIVRRMPKNDPLRPYFMKGLLLKLLGGLGVAAVYAFYYKYGDTISYYYRALQLQGLFFDDPRAYFKVLRVHSAALANIQTSVDLTDRLYDGDATLFVIKSGAILGWICGFSFFGISAWVSFISYSGIWKLFRFFSKLFPHLIPQIAIGLLYLPSIFFWGSGLMKDPFSFAALGWLVFSIYQLFVEKKHKLRSIVNIIIACYVLIIVKVYILGTLMPALIIWAIINYKNRIKTKLIRGLFMPVLLLLIAIGINSLVNTLGTQLTQLATATVLAEVTVKHEFNFKQAKNESDTGSSYPLGEIEATASSILKAIPRMVNIALFKPYPWETRKIVQFLSGIESFGILIFTIIVLLRSRIIGFFGVIFRSPVLIFFFFFTLIFAFLVGISSGTYGSLVRYKIPCIPFFLTLLFAVNHHYKEKKKLRLKGG